MGLIEIPFCDAMWDECRSIALARSAPKRDWSYRMRESDDANMVGVVGEAAVCFFFGCRLNREIHNGDGHAPDVVVGGIGIEVKATKYSPPHLKMCSLKEFGRDSTIAVMVHVDDRRKVATLWGWVDRRKFVEDHVTRDYGHGVRLVMEPRSFSDMLILKGIYRSSV